MGGLGLCNFFFISLRKDMRINHVKISIKFDNNKKGKARISFRVISTPPRDGDLDLFLLIKNDENPAQLERLIGSDYNRHLDTEEFRTVAGAYELSHVEDHNSYSAFKLKSFPEHSNLKDKTAIHPKEIECKELGYEDMPEQLKNAIGRRDILIRVGFKESTKILEELASFSENSFVCMFQFRLFLEDFVPEKTLRSWRFSNKSWCVDFDMHKERGYEYFVAHIPFKEALRYPNSVELWFTIPSSHFFVASSPVYTKAFRLKSGDLKYKTEQKPNTEFETREGDYAVKIMNDTGWFMEFSIICVSPFLIPERPKKLRHDIERLMSRNYVTWDNLINPLILLIAVLALVIATVNVFINDMSQETKLALNLPTFLAAALFFGLSVWGIAMPVYLLFSKRTDLENDLHIRCLSVGIVSIILIIAIFFFYFLIKENFFH
jgi:hypothetical protein